MSTIDAKLADAILTQSLNLNRLEAGIRKKVIGLLIRMQKDLTVKLNEQTLTEIGRADTNRLLKQANEVIADYYYQAGGVVDMPEIGRTVASATTKDLDAAYMGMLSVSLPTEGYIKSLASNVLIEGAPSAAWWAKQSLDMQFKFAGAVRQGLIQAETNKQIIRRVRDEIGVHQRHAAALVQTSVQTVANDARLETFKQNADVVKGLVWIGTLDARICGRCIARDGLEWTLEGKPVGHSVPFQNPPIHWNDRCVLTVRTATFKELGIDIPEPSPGPRATAGGPVEGNFDSWLGSKSKSFQDDLLGPGRADLYRRGVITRAQLLDVRGNELTLAQLRDKYA